MKKVPEVHILNTQDGDWVALYLNKKRVFQGHSINVRGFLSVLRKAGVSLGFSFSERDTTTKEDREVTDAGDFPEELF
jgi:hypothetical protein